MLKLLFGRKRKKNFIQEANRRSVLKGTVGSFGRWCKSQGLASKDGKVTLGCINKGKKSKNLTIRRRANFAKNIKAYTRSRFGKKKVKKYKKFKKYTAAGGRKSPGVSARNFPVGTVKKGLDGKSWVIVKVGTSKRWKRMSTKRKTLFGNTTATEYMKNILFRIKVLF